MTEWLWTLLGGMFLVGFLWVTYFGRVTSHTKGLGYALLMVMVPMLLFFLARLGDMGWRQVWPNVLGSAVGVLVALAVVLAGFAGEKRERERKTAKWLAELEERESKT